MKKIYFKPEMDCVALAGTWSICEGTLGSGDGYNMPDPLAPPAPKKRTPAF